MRPSLVPEKKGSLPDVWRRRTYIFATVHGRTVRARGRRVPGHAGGVHQDMLEVSVVQFDRGDHGADRTRARTLWLLSRTRGGIGAVHARVGACLARLVLLGSRDACNSELLLSESHAHHERDESVPWVVGWDAFETSWQQVCQRLLARAAPARGSRAKNGQ